MPSRSPEPGLLLCTAAPGSQRGCEGLIKDGKGGATWQKVNAFACRERSLGPQTNCTRPPHPHPPHTHTQVNGTHLPSPDGLAARTPPRPPGFCSAGASSSLTPGAPRPPLAARTAGAEARRAERPSPGGPAAPQPCTPHARGPPRWRPTRRSVRGPRRRPRAGPGPGARELGSPSAGGSPRPGAPRGWAPSLDTPGSIPTRPGGPRSAGRTSRGSAVGGFGVARLCPGRRGPGRSASRAPAKIGSSVRV